MKLLFDQNLSYKLVQNLQNKYPGSKHVYQIGMSEDEDIDIWFYARKLDFTIVTQDNDFYERSLVVGFPPKIILIKTGNASTEYILHLLIKNEVMINEFENQSNLSCLILY